MKNSNNTIWAMISLMAATLLAADLSAAESRSEAKTAKGKPDITKLSVAEINKVQPPPEGLFPVPFHPGVPVPSSQIWGGMFMVWHEGTYYMIYDAFSAGNPLPGYLLTSKDGVYWKQEGAYFDKDNPNRPFFNPELYKLRPDGPIVMAYENEGVTHFATSYDMNNGVESAC